MQGRSLYLAMLGWLLVLGLASVVVQLFSGVLHVRWLPRFEVWTDYGQVIFAIIGIVLEVLWWLLAFKLAVEALRAGARGEEQHSWRDNWIDDEQALRQMLLWVGLLSAGYGIYRFSGGLALGAYSALLLLTLPAILVLLGMEDSLKRAFDPSAWAQLFQQTGFDYLLAVLKLALVAAVLAFVQLQMVPRESSWMHGPVSRMAWLLALFVAYHELGRLLDRHRSESALAVAAAPGPAAEPAPEELLAMRAAERLGVEQRYGRAARELEALAGKQGTSAQLHTMYRHLLTLAGDHERLLGNARGYIPELLAQGQEDQALQLYADSLAVDPAFELAQARPVTLLFEATLRAHRVEQAIALAHEFLRRFPEEADAVPNGLSAARLLDRQGRDEEARGLLVDLVRRFPRHPLRGELVAALETLEGVARRGG